MNCNSFFVFALRHNEKSTMVQTDKYGVRRNQFYVIDLIKKYYTGANETSQHTILNIAGYSYKGSNGRGSINSAFKFNC